MLVAVLQQVIKLALVLSEALMLLDSPSVVGQKDLVQGDELGQQNFQPGLSTLDSSSLEVQKHHWVLWQSTWHSKMILQRKCNDNSLLAFFSDKIVSPGYGTKILSEVRGEGV